MGLPPRLRVVEGHQGKGLHSPLQWLTRSTFLTSLRTAINNEVGFAAGKLGYSEQVWLVGRGLLKETSELSKFGRAVRASVRFHACMQCGVFPSTDDQLDRAGLVFADAAASMDFLAVHESRLAVSAIHELSACPHLVSFNDLEPNKDAPYRGEDCYLPDLRNRRILIVTTPAELLVSRATRDVFERTWDKIQCPWFSPMSVEGISFSSLFSSDASEKFSSSLELQSVICDEIASRNFDVALIGASSLGVPLAAFVKSLGKVAISLGGHLQVLFGVQGGRWINNPHWQQAYVTDAWVNMPVEFRPTGRRWLVDDGAYW